MMNKNKLLLIDKFDEKTQQEIQSYVYMLLDPQDDKLFYVGKGANNRVFDHMNCDLEDTGTSTLKYDKIREINERGQVVKHVIVRHGLSDDDALQIEASLIDTLNYCKLGLSNEQSGYNSVEKGLMTSEEITRLYNAEPLDSIESNCVIININKTYKRGSSENAIYDATKEIWDIKEHRRNQIQFVLSEYKGLIVEVFKVEKWYSKERGYNPGAIKYGQTYLGYGFEGEIAEETERNKYINKSISPFKKRGFASVLIFPETLQKLKNN